MTARRADLDRALVTRFLAGEQAAFDEIMTAHEGRVFSVCLRIMRDREAALDATQETFVTVYRKAHLYTGEAAFSTWLYRVAVNTCYDQLRKMRRRRTEPIPEGRDPRDEQAGAALTAAELRPDIDRAIGALPDEFRNAVILSDLEGWPLADVAEVLGVPIGTVKSRVFRGRRILAEHLGNLRPTTPRQTDDHA